MIVHKIAGRLQSSFAAYKRYLSNLGATFLSQAATALSILLLTPHLLQELGPEKFGHYGIFLNIVIFSSIFDFGLNVGLLRRLIHQKEHGNWVINAMLFFFLLVFILSIPVFYILYRSEILQSSGSLSFMAFFTGLVMLQNIIALFFDVMIQSVDKIFVGKVIRIAKTIIEFGLLFYVARFRSVSMLILSTFLINVLYILCLFYYSKKEVRYKVSWKFFKLTVLREHLSYSFWYFQNTLATVLVYNGQVLLISNFVDNVSTAKYLLVVRFYEVIRTGLTNFTMVLFPSLSILQAKEDWHKIKGMFLKVFLRVTLFVLIVFALVLTLGEKIFLKWSSYNDGAIISIFQLYSIYMALLVIDHVPTVFLSALKFNKQPSILGTVQGILGLLLSAYFLPKYGVIGAVSASLIALFSTNLLFNPLFLFNRINAHLRKVQAQQ